MIILQLHLRPKKRKMEKNGKECSGMLARKAKVSHRPQLKILSPKQMIQRLLIAIAQAKTDNTFENLLSDICQIIHFLHRAK